ncbi:MAG TPA: alpha/beta hydrolase [Acidimicrobiales bacterium]
MRHATTYVLIPGAGSDAWHWHLVVPELRRRGHDVVAVDLPCDDDAAGLPEYVDAVVAAVGDRVDRGDRGDGGDRGELVLVAQSMGALTAPLVCDRLPVDLLVLVAAMVPAPGERPADWWDAVGHDEARRRQAAIDGTWSADDDDPVTMFLHDVPPAVAAAAGDHARPQSGRPFQDPWPRDAWPDVPTRFLLCRHDRFFPADLLRRVACERLGITPDEMDGGHLPALARPQELVERLEAYRRAR